ncbi:MAG TPA: DUF4292 domain-containing protein [Balneolaceae bacterium]|nr:DUF4292 domain-containing protein [Balneolaceae bacterium]
MRLKNSRYFLRFGLLLIASITLYSCSTSKKLADQNYHPADVETASVVSKIPDYRGELHSVKGEGRAIVSEPGNTERVTLLFSSNRQKSLVTIRNGIGIEGGQLLTDGDTLLIYNKIDEYARKIPIKSGNLDRINRLAALNILDIISYSLSSDEVQTVLESNKTFKLILDSGTEIYVDKKSYLVQKVVQPKHSQLPYSKITYDAYGSLNGFILPRRITIFGAEEKSKIALQLTALELNPNLNTLSINLPNDIPVYYR